MKRKLNYALLLAVISSIVLALACQKKTPKNYYFKYSKGGNTVTLNDTSQFAAVGTGNLLTISASDGTFYFLGYGANRGTGNFQASSIPIPLLTNLFYIQFQGLGENPLSISGTGNISNISDGDIKGTFDLQFQNIIDTALYEPVTIEYYAPYYRQ
jgi:hypothetical protein